MAEYYVDLGRSSSGTGTPASPFNYNDMWNFLNPYEGWWTSAGGSKRIVSAGDTMLMKGTKTDGSTMYLLPWAFSANNVKFIPWNSELYGFWGFHSTDYGEIQLVPTDTYLKSQTYVYVSGCAVGADENADIIFYQGFTGNPTGRFKIEFSNSIFAGDFVNYGCTSAFTNDGNKYKGCTFYNGNLYFGDYNGLEPVDDKKIEEYFEDCVFYNYTIDTYSLSGVIDKFSFTNCIFSGTSAAVFIDQNNDTDLLVLNNCTFSWIPTCAMPNFSAISASNKGNLIYENFGLSYVYGLSAGTSTSAMKSYYAANGLTSAAYASYRRGPGAFYFPNKTFYVSLNTSAEGTGTQLSPFNSTNLLRNVTYPNDILKITGYISGSNLQFSDNVILDSWNMSTVEPYTLLMNDKDISGNNLTFLNGILIFSTSGNKNFNFYPKLIKDCMLVISGTNPKLSVSGIEKEFKLIGSTLIFTSGYNLNLYNNVSGYAIDAKDCVFDMDSFCGNTLHSATSAYLNNCVIRPTSFYITKGNIFSAGMPNGVIPIQGINIQYNWIPPTWPNFINKSKDNFKYTVLTSGTHTISISGSGEW